jgi:hypothetical protein
MVSCPYLQPMEKESVHKKQIGRSCRLKFGACWQALRVVLSLTRSRDPFLETTSPLDTALLHLSTSAGRAILAAQAA